MKLFPLLALAVALLSTASLSAAPQDLLAKESLGALKIGQPAAALEKAIGKTEKKGKEVEQDATGEWVQDWEYPAQGLKIVMASGKKGGVKSVSAITAGKNCNLATARGIKLGSTMAEVRKAYGKVESREDGQTADTFIAGSVYGGVIFKFRGDKVASIFIGAAAE